MTYIFLGPSLPLNEAKTILDANYLPPAKQGDIISLVEEKKPEVIALIDGYFFQAVSVWHKELLWALERGIPCYGASSMGALRAAETERYGMVGVGEIFKLYKEGLHDDDEVALVHAPAEKGFLNLTISMVNVRFTLKHAVANELLSGELAEAALKQAKGLLYEARTLDNICKGLPEEVRHIFQNHYVDQKREDAKALLKALRTEKIEPPALNEPIVDSPYRKVIYYQERSVTVDETPVPLASIVKHTALHHPKFSQVRARALNRYLVSTLARILGIEVNAKEIAEARYKFCKKIDNLGAWLAENNLSEEDFSKLIEEQAIAEKLYRSPLCAKWKFHKAILDELHLSGEYAQWAKETAIQQKLVPFYLDKIEEEIYDKQIMSQHLKETKWDLDTDTESWSVANGFANINDLAFEVLRAKNARKALASHLMGTLFSKEESSSK